MLPNYDKDYSVQGLGFRVQKVGFSFSSRLEGFRVLNLLKFSTHPEKIRRTLHPRLASKLSHSNPLLLPHKPSSVSTYMPYSQSKLNH